jgi:hypothetical protein
MTLFCGRFANSAANAYLWRMFKAFEFCLPTNATKVPAGPKFLALVMVASAVVVSSTSAFAQPHKRTHYRGSNSINVIRGPVERQPTWIPSPGFNIPNASTWGG